MSRRRKRKRRRKSVSKDTVKTKGIQAPSPQPSTVDQPPGRGDVRSHEDPPSDADPITITDQGLVTTRNAPASAPKRDFSDHVKHLRLINFSLLVASVGVFVTITHTPARDIDRAYADLERVVSISLKWDAGHIEDEAKEHASQHFAESIDSVSTPGESSPTTITPSPRGPSKAPTTESRP